MESKNISRKIPRKHLLPRYVRQKKRTEDKDVDEGEPEDPTKDEPVSSRNEQSTPETRRSKRLKLDL